MKRIFFRAAVISLMTSGSPAVWACPDLSGDYYCPTLVEILHLEQSCGEFKMNVYEAKRSISRVARPGQLKDSVEFEIARVPYRNGGGDFRLMQRGAEFRDAFLLTAEERDDGRSGKQITQYLLLNNGGIHIRRSIDTSVQFEADCTRLED